MPLSWPYGVTGPVVGQMFHVKHSLWRRWCSRRCRARLWGRAAVCAGGRRPSCCCCLWLRWCSGRRRPRPPARLGDLTSFGAAPRSPPVPSGPSGALHTSGAWSLSAVPRRLVRRLVVRPGPATAHGHRDRAREGMQKVRSPCGSADLRGTPAVPEFAQWRSAFTRRLASASSLS